ncbi:MAG TPA: serine hydrolase domain-containing protein [Bacteroidia bacterium]|nr:serine hydrolase domain-containing protein [Bacteroidia bacterium]
MHKLLLISFSLICFSCGQSNSEFGGMGFMKPEAPAVIKRTSKYKDIAFRLDTLFSKMSASGFNGAVIVAKDGEVIYQKAFGYADKKNNIPVSDTTSFQLASVSKVITATAVMTLVEKGLIKLDDTFASYFPEFPYTTITIKELLAHRSGLPNYLYFLNDIVTSKEKILTNAEMLQLMVEKKPPLYLKPNYAFNYCNTNYALLALLVEKVSHKTFSNYLREEIFLPLGMKHSGTILSLDIFEKSVSKPYDNRWKIIEREASDYIVGDKSIFSTPYDMFLFSEALYQGKLLNPETQVLSYTALSREKKLSNYGLGWRMKDFKNEEKKEVFHNGWWHGYRTAFHRRLSDKITIVVLSNQLNRSAYQTYKIYQAIDADTLFSNEADTE